ncbi:MAG: hypothetical protein ACU841_02125, partial [Gammaproteobacteria bacterium]
MKFPPPLGNNCRMKLLPVLKRLQRDYGLPVLYASQSLSEILELTDRLVVLENGKILHGNDSAYPVNPFSLREKVRMMTWTPPH